MAASEGAIGFAVQKELLEAAAPLLPQTAEVCLMADRFYGTAELIAWCQDRTWDYRRDCQEFCVRAVVIRPS